MISPFAPALAVALIAAMWQGAVLVVVAGCALRLLPGLSSGARSLVWMAVFVLLIGLHLQPAHGAAAGAVHGDARMSFALVAIWLACSVGRATQFLVAALTLRRLAERAVPVAAPDAVREVLAGFGTELCLSGDVDRPSVVGFWKRRILLPPVLAGQLTPEALHAVVLHELEHLRRRDDWTNLFQKLALVVFPLNPALFWVERRLCVERELACDDGVLRQTGARKVYATTLANLAEYAFVRRGVSLALRLVGGRRSELTRRVARILARPGRMLGPWATALAMVALLGGMTLGAVKLGRSPELVSFAAPPMIAEASLASAAGELPVRAVLTRAALPVNSGRVEPRSQNRDLGHPGVRRVRVRRASRRLVEPQFVRAEWQEMPVRVVRQVWVQQVSFAAIATPDGWLVVQL